MKGQQSKRKVAVTTLKLKKCKACKGKFKPFNSMQKVCSVPCSLELVKRENRKKFDLETRQRKEAAKTRADWLREAQTAINWYVRLRDKGKPCISCDKPDNGQHQRHASHYKSVGSNSALRFNLYNIHASCASCNNHLSGNILNYTPRLIIKIGQDRFDWLLTQNQPVKYEIAYLKRLKMVFNRKARRLQKLYSKDCG